MSTVGKILVVLHLVLSVMFMAFAAAVYTAQNNWRAAEKKAQASLTAANTKIKEMQTESERQLADIAQKNAALEDDVVRVKGREYRS